MTGRKTPQEMDPNPEKAGRGNRGESPDGDRTDGFLRVALKGECVPDSVQVIGENHLNISSERDGIGDSGQVFNSEQLSIPTE